MTAGLLSANAQIVLDGKFGTGGPLTGPNYTIPAEVGAVRGQNLFHSFTRFDLATKETATFTGPANIQNILARVTGDVASSIDGTIRSKIAGANFFLINPHGISFGPNAKVDVTGSFAASSADYLKLGDDARFVAALDADDSGLSTAPVSAFGFLGATHGDLSVNNSLLAVAEGKQFSLVGGNIRLDGGTVKAPAGEIHLASVQGAGQVPVDPGSVSATAFAAAFPEQGSIEVKNSALIDGSGKGGGRVVIRGGKLTVDNSKIQSDTTGTSPGQGIEVSIIGDLSLANTAQINSRSPAGRGEGGNIDISADTIRMAGDPEAFDFTQIAAGTGDPFSGGGAAQGGDISIKANSLILRANTQIASETGGRGNAGNIEIETSHLSLDAQLSFAMISANVSGSRGTGKAGDVVIRTDSFELANGATVLAATFGAGDAGVIDIHAKSMDFRYGGIISAATFGSGAGGNVMVTAGNLRLDGSDPAGGPSFPTGIQAITTSQVAKGRGGDVTIVADSVDMRNVGSIFTTSSGPGAGGNISIDAGSLSLMTGANIRAAGEEDGPAGNIALNVRGPLMLEGGSSINTSAPGSSGGNINISTGGNIRLFNSEINAQAGLNGGNVSLNSPSLMYLKESTVTGQADTTGTGFGNGGNLTLSPSLLILKESGLISKSSFGNGGNISILSDYFFPSETIIDATAPFGLPGTVQVTAPEVDLSGVLAVLTANFIDAAALLRPDCGIRLGGNISSFIVMGRGGLPLMPGGFVPSEGLSVPHEEK